MRLIRSRYLACALTASCLACFISGPAHAQSGQLATCINDYRPEIAAGLRSKHYPRCVDDHTRPERLSGVVNIREVSPGPTSCPSGQVFSGGACVSLPSDFDRAWTTLFTNQTRYLGDGRIWVRINGDGSVDSNAAPYGEGAKRIYNPSVSTGSSPIVVKGCWMYDDSQTSGPYLALFPEGNPSAGTITSWTVWWGSALQGCQGYQVRAYYSNGGVSGIFYTQ
jgi:hypothetical protein